MRRHSEASLLNEDPPPLTELARAQGRTQRQMAATRTGLRIKRCGPGEVKVLDKTGREIAELIRELSGRRWRVAMAPALVRTLSPSDPIFDSQRAALSWLADLQFDW